MKKPAARVPDMAARPVSNLRIIGGAHKGRLLQAPAGLDTRPIPDRIKQSLFDWLGQRLDGKSFVDVCSGSGSVGLEAYSRGAAQIHLIEPGQHAVAALTANLRALRNPPSVRWHRALFQAVLPTLRDIDVVFADPPFPWFREDMDALSALLTCARDCLKSDGALMLRGESGYDLPLLPDGMMETERRVYGRSWIARIVRT
jgi:16S rRNA (guanine966-N2)-methyltransferase